MFQPLISAVLLGILEGLTEFIPVSSTGHLILLGDLMGFTGDGADTFEIFIQLGAIMAVVVLYFERFRALIPGRGRPTTGFSGTNGLFKLLVACLPAFVLGFLLHHFIKERLFNPQSVAIALIVGGIVMILIERRGAAGSVASVESLSLRRCFGIGLFQCFALWPGMSRSASTIVGAMLLGVDRRTAAEFSFIVAVPVMVAAVGYDLLKSFGHLGRQDLVIFAVGFVVSFVVAVLAIKIFLALLQRFTLVPFGVYRIVLGFLVLLTA